MSKFKVGDKARVKLTGKVGVISRAEEWRTFPYMLKDDPKKEPFGESELERVESVREFIVIRRDDRDVIASHKRGDEIVKTAKATCAPSDEFNFDTGAKLAFDRLMGREEPKPAPQPAPKFKVGDRVVTKECGIGEIVAFNKDKDSANECCVSVEKNGLHSGRWFADRSISAEHEGKCRWFSSKELSPAPEPKYYTGKVVCVENTSMLCQEDFVIGKIYSISDGAVTSNSTPFAKSMMYQLKSVEHLNKRLGSAVKFAEVKE